MSLSKPITIQRIKKDLAKMCDVEVVREKTLTHLYYKKYIAHVYIGGVAILNIEDNEEHYQQALEKVKKRLKKSGKPRQSIRVDISGAHSQEEIDKLHENKEKSKQTFPNLKTNIKKQKVPKGSLKYRVKIDVHTRDRKDVDDTVEQFTNLFGEDKKSSSFVNIPSWRWHKNYGYGMTPIAVYVNFDNEDDIVMLAPFNNHSCIRSMKLEIFDGE